MNTILNSFISLRRWRCGVPLLLLMGLISLSFVGYCDEPGTTGVPEPIQKLISAQDSNATFRDDGLVSFSNKLQYVLISPEATMPVDTLTISSTIPEKSKTPDVIAFNDGHYLLRIITLPGGRQTFPIPDTIPLGLRTGLLPQDFTFPPHFLLPTAWKSLAGNLLENTTTAISPTVTTSYPLALYHPENNTITIWNPDKGKALQTVSLPCPLSDQTDSADGKTLYMACRDQPTLLYLKQGETLQSLPVAGPIVALACDADLPHLFVAYDTVKKLTVVNTNTNQVEKDITLPYPSSRLAISQFRRQLFVFSITPPPPTSYPDDAKVVHWLHTRKGQAIIKARRLHKIKIPLTTLVQIINTNALQIDKSINTLPDIGFTYVQDEKFLWTFSRSQQQIQAFDLRWQDFSKPLDVTGNPIAMASDESWLYLLSAETQTLQRLDIHDNSSGSSIQLQPGPTPQAMILDEPNQQAYVVSNNPAGLEIINLKRAQWVGTQKLPGPTQSPIAWLSPDVTQSVEQLRIKFDNGRFLPQKAQLPLPEASSTDAHDPGKNQTQSGQSKKKSILRKIF